jgi:hypothetical protein
MARNDTQATPVLSVPDAGPGGYIENTRSLKLQTVHIADQVLRYLKANQEEYVLRCIQVAP